MVAVTPAGTVTTEPCMPPSMTVSYWPAPSSVTILVDEDVLGKGGRAQPDGVAGVGGVDGSLDGGEGGARGAGVEGGGMRRRDRQEEGEQQGQDGGQVGGCMAWAGQTAAL